MRSPGLTINKPAEYFACKRCGACCRGRDVSLTLDDIFRLSEFLDLDPDTFFSRYCVEAVKGKSPMAMPYLRRDEEACHFLDENICLAHFAKPTACLLLPSTSFGGIEHMRSRMPPSCAIHQANLVDTGDAEQKRRNYVTAMMLTTIYYNQYGTFQYALAKPFIYRILLFRRNREQVYRITNSGVSGN